MNERPSNNDDVVDRALGKRGAVAELWDEKKKESGALLGVGVLLVNCEKKTADFTVNELLKIFNKYPQLKDQIKKKIKEVIRSEEIKKGKAYETDRYNISLRINTLEEIDVLFNAILNQPFVEKKRMVTLEDLTEVKAIDIENFINHLLELYSEENEDKTIFILEDTIRDYPQFVNVVGEIIDEEIEKSSSLGKIDALNRLKFIYVIETLEIQKPEKTINKLLTMINEHPKLKDMIDFKIKRLIKELEIAKMSEDAHIVAKIKVLKEVQSEF